MGTQAVSSLVSCFHNASLRPGVLLSPFLALIWAQGPAEHNPWVLRALRETGRTPHPAVYSPTSLLPSMQGPPEGAASPLVQTHPPSWPIASLFEQKTGKARSRAHVHMRIFQGQDSHFDLPTGWGSPPFTQSSHLRIWGPFPSGRC